MPSSVIAHMHYDPVTHTLRVHFVSGLIYEYNKVPEDVFREMKQAYSKGTFLNQRIKGHFPYKKVSTLK